MNFFRVGVVNFFGILCPGVLLMINLLVLLSVFGFSTKDMLGRLPELHGALLLLLVFVICYLFGFVLRLISPDYLDKASTWFGVIKAPRRYISKLRELQGLEKEKPEELEKSKEPGELQELENELRELKQLKQRKLRELQELVKNRRWFLTYLLDHYKILFLANFLTSFKKKKRVRRELLGAENGVKIVRESTDGIEQLPRYFWNDELYPYYWATRAVYRWMLPDIPASKISKIIGTEKHFTKRKLNYLKIKLVKSDSNLTAMVYQAEAFVRFVSGSFWALLVGVVAGIIFFLTNFGGSSENIVLFIFFTVISVIMLVVILNTFKNQRRREVQIIVDSMLVLPQTVEDFAETSLSNPS